MTYHQLVDEDGEEYGSFETFYIDETMLSSAPLPEGHEKPDANSEWTEPGWYWWACSPGCLPDGEANGPFETEEQAIADARDA
jgi:hypothetical protein